VRHKRHKNLSFPPKKTKQNKTKQKKKVKKKLNNINNNEMNFCEFFTAVEASAKIGVRAISTAF